MASSKTELQYNVKTLLLLLDTIHLDFFNPQNRLEHFRLCHSELSVHFALASIIETNQRKLNALK